VHWGPHEGPQADLFTGIGGYQFAGATYGQATHEQKLSCVDCHMVPVADNVNVPDHSFAPNLSACLTCHAGNTTFDVNGFQGDVQSALTAIETWFYDQGFLTRADSAPYTLLTTAQLGDGNWAEDEPVPGATLDGGLLTQNQAGASTTTSSSRAAETTACTTRGTSGSSSTIRTRSWSRGSLPGFQPTPVSRG
jgi:hypothetical protein